MDNSQEFVTYKIKDLCKTNNNKLRQYDQVDRIANYVLCKKRCFSADNVLSAMAIIEEYKSIKSNHPDLFEIADGTFTSYLSYLANNASRITRAPKKNGYFLNRGNSYGSKSGNKLAAIINEKELYPILEYWLSFRCDRVNNIANNHKGKQWSNPDILGVNYTVFFSNNIIEITTIEAKVSLDNWRINFFEAVAHSMFANKAYFAYLCKESEKTESDLLLYAQKFGIGVIAIQVPDDDWKQDMEIKLEYVKEIFPAPTHNTNVYFQKEFLDNFELFDIKDINKFGKTNSDFI